jgi:Fe-S cluster biosynthesis and repair protein YggX
MERIRGVKVDNLKHKVFISYYHADDQWYKNQLLLMNERNEIFQDYSVHEQEIDDTDMTDETIREKIRDEYIKDATVLILLCGKNTSKRKFIDWELRAAMFDTEKNPKLGILVINLPGTNNNIQRANDDDERKSIGNDLNWVKANNDRKELEKQFQHLPSRVIDNLADGVPICIVNWDRISNNAAMLMSLIDISYNKKSTCKYNISAPLWGRNR